MEWLIDVLREPVADILGVVLSGLAVAIAARVRGRARRVERRVDEVEQAVRPSDL